MSRSLSESSFEGSSCSLVILLEAWRIREVEGRIRRGRDERAFLKAMNMGMCMAFSDLGWWDCW